MAPSRLVTKAARAVALPLTAAGLLAAVPAGASSASSSVAASSSVGTYVKAYAGMLDGSQVSLSPVDVEPTSDGGAIALSLAETTRGLGVIWLVKLNSAGT